MANGSLPTYLASAQPNPQANRAPWFKNTAPAYFGIFMWVAFYDQMGGALGLGGLGGALIGLVVAALLSHYLYHYVFGLLGMKTGYPLYVVGSSTFGTKGGYLFPGIFMGLLQIGWYSVGTYYATKLLLGAFGIEAQTIFDAEYQGFSLLFVILAIAWGYIFALFGAFGIQYVAMISTYLPWISLIMLAIGAGMAAPYVGDFKPESNEYGGLLAGMMVVQLVIGFFATAGAAGADFGTASRNASDVNKAGWFGVTLSAIVAGGLALVIVAGAQGKYQKENPVAVVVAENVEMAPVADDAVVIEKEEVAAAVPVVAPKKNIVASFTQIAPKFDWLVFLVLAIGSMAPACFCSSIIGNSLSTMIPSLPRVPLTLIGATVGIVLAALGIASNLAPFFGLIGASFGPICGAMVADYLLSGCKWSGPRKGLNPAGYLAWIVGFLMGIANNPMVTDLLKSAFGLEKALLPGWEPTAVYSFVVGFIVYLLLAKAGLQPETVAMPAGIGAPEQPVTPVTAPGEPLPPDNQ